MPFGKAMGTEIVFVIICPVALFCVATAIWSWFAVVKAEQPSAIECIRGYLPLVTGFAVSMVGLALLTYMDCDADFTSLIEQGYYTEVQRPIYLPWRIFGQTIVNLVFVLPAICLVTIPWTAKLVRTSRLTLSGICIRAVIVWGALSLMGWLWNLSAIIPPDPLPYFLKSTVVPVLIYGLPIPIAALLLFPRKRRGLAISHKVRP